MAENDGKQRVFPISCIVALITPIVGAIGGWIVGWSFGRGDLPSPDVMAMIGGIIGFGIGTIIGVNFAIIGYLRGEFRVR